MHQTFCVSLKVWEGLQKEKKRKLWQLRQLRHFATFATHLSAGVLNFVHSF